MRESATLASSVGATAPKGRPGEDMPLTTSRPELLADGSDGEFRRLVHSLFGFFARHEQIRAGHAKVIGLGGSEYTVLIAIAHLARAGKVNVKTVAAHLHLSGAFITTMTQRLLRLGLVCKKVDPKDRRRVTLTVSEAGHRLLERLAPVQRRVNDVEFDCLSAEDFRFLLRVVDRLIDSSDRAVALQKYLLAEMGQE
jgi:MarR family transcriptional regulator, organic hydroperoxide resistance regulator